MTLSGWRLAGWVWVVVMNLIGLGVLFAQAFLSENTQLEGQGTALLLIAACLLFAVVFTTWDWQRNILAAVASFSTATFGFLGTSYILAGENAALLTILGVTAFYSVSIVLMTAFASEFL